ncbi:DNA repair protein RecN (Recombination protein N) [Selenomonas ruminantium]|uniref:DNA repair protein RecN n=1 Tax=Selenomonas ruminantium TaxID=971 RepID=A0A1M6WI03_SELRU|nr:DNA repair protein RecN [Selenomonas ruminantium]SHK93380.1 DNA repair protein RecN (Recombination protein N) [Selenomonas ruminantium]
MLKTLTVWNFALLEHVQVEFGEGLNILTGETGAGKSILIDALGAILGQRVSSDAIRTGCDWLRVEAVFTLDDESLGLHELLSGQAIDDSEGMLIITRQVTRGGRSMVLVNGCHVTLTILKQIGAFLVDIHGQNENLALLKEESQFALLDEYDPDLTEALAGYKQIYTAWRDKQQEHREKEQAAREYAQRLDMLRWQDKEISEAELRENEDEELDAEIRKLSHAEKIAGFVEESYNLLDVGAGGGQAVLAAVARVKKNLEDMSRYDDSLENTYSMVEEAYISLQEAASDLRDYGESLEFQPAKLDRLQNRMDVIDRLCRKYGATIADVLDHQQKVQQELLDIENYDDDMARLEKEIAALEEKLRAKADNLTKMRQRAAGELAAAIGSQLTALGMLQAAFHIRVTPAERYLANGADNVAMYFSANPGEEEKLLSKVASGGELSRIALAIKTVAASRDSSVPSMVFDEIDTGIGGRTAQMVAERIALVAQYKQVLCITHLPQIACMADNHLYIAKTSAGESTVTQVRPLTERERISEIARMASGVDVTTASLDNAKEMVSHAKLIKKNFVAETKGQ